MSKNFKISCFQLILVTSFLVSEAFEVDSIYITIILLFTELSSITSSQTCINIIYDTQPDFMYLSLLVCSVWFKHGHHHCSAFVLVL